MQDNSQVIDRVGLAVSALGDLVCLMLVSGALQAYLAGDESGWFARRADLSRLVTGEPM